MTEVHQQPAPPFPPQHQDPPGSEAELSPRPRFRGTLYREAGKLEGKVALVTGGDSGIGRSVAVLYAREGASVAITHLAQEQLDAQETVKAVEEAGGRALAIEGDLRDPEFAKSAVKQTVDTFGHLDILVNNAAYQQHKQRIEDITDEEWDRTLRTNIGGYFYMARAAVPFMSAGSSIINTGSVAGIRGSSGLLDYSTTKGAIHAFTKTLALELNERGIRVNCVAPGPVWTPLNPADRPAEEVANFGKQVPMGRPAQPEEIAPAFVFFASEGDSSFVSGEILVLQGGAPT